MFIKLRKVFILSITIILLSSVLVFAKANSDSYVYISPELRSLINTKLGDGDYHYEYLSDFNNSSRYVLVAGNNSYLIYDSFIGDYIEYSNSSPSPYNELRNCSKIYLAPTYYFYKRNNNYYDVFDDSVVSSSLLNDYIDMEIFLKDDYLQKKNNQTTNNLRTTEYISKGYYFQNLKTNIGSNDYYMFRDSCTYVSLGMILSYYDSIANDIIIPEFYDVTVSKSFSNYSSINCISYTESPGINDLFHSFLIGYGCAKNYTTLWVTDPAFHIDTNDIYYFLIDYFQKVGLSINAYSAQTITDKFQFCIDAIDSDNPVIIKILGLDSSIYSSYLNHTIVGYGYDSTGIFAHFGWKGSTYTNINIHNYTISKAVYMNYTDVHSHSDNYKWSVGASTGAVCPCGVKTCYHTDLMYVWNDYTHHYKNCICGIHELQPHIISRSEYLENKSYYTCLICDGPASSGFIQRELDNGDLLLSNGVIVQNDTESSND